MKVSKLEELIPVLALKVKEKKELLEASSFGGNIRGEEGPHFFSYFLLQLLTPVFLFSSLRQS